MFVKNGAKVKNKSFYFNESKGFFKVDCKLERF